MNDIIQLKVTLQYSKPPIWRRILVEKDTSFSTLHDILQITMGWHNSHLYDFNIGQRRIGMMMDDDFLMFGGNDMEDDTKITLGEVLTKEKQKFVYNYDFGDSWTHQILVEKFLPRDSQLHYPACIKGKLNCPPEDCGGIYGFYHLLEVIQDKKHPEREDMLEWLEEGYDETFFDQEQVNARLKNI